MLARQTPIIAIVNMINSAVVLGVFWSEAPGLPLAIWCAAVWLASLQRVRSWRRVETQSPKPAGVGRRLVRQAALWSTASGMLWGLAAAALFTPDSHAHLILLVFLVGGMSAGAVASLSILPPACAGFIVSSIVPLTLRIALQGTTVTLAMAMMASIFLVALLFFLRNGHAAFLAEVRAELEKRALVTELEGREQLEKGRNKVLRELAAGTPLDDVLTTLIVVTEANQPDMICSVLLLDEEGRRLHHGAAPNLPADYVAAIDGLEIGPAAGSCGTAAFTAERVIVEDVDQHPYWSAFRDQARRAGLRACWSEPILSASRQVLGTFAIYYRDPRAPDPASLELIETAAKLAAIAIERKQAERALAEKTSLLNSLVRFSPINIAIKDTEGRFLLINPEYEKAFDITDEAIRGRTLHDLFPREFADVYAAQDRQVLESGLPVTAEFEAPHADGRRHIYLSTKFPVLNAEGAPIAVALMETDITNRKQMEETLRESEERFRGVVENSPSAIFLKDTQGRFRLVNKRFVDWYGIPAAQVVGKTTQEIFPRLQALSYVAQDEEVLRTRQVVEKEHEIEFQDGTTHSILVTKFPVLDACGRPLGIGTINTDLTEPKRAMAALRESEAALAKAQRLAKIGNWRRSVEGNALVSCSQEFARIHGVGPEEIHGLMAHQMERVVHPQDRARVAEAFKRFAEEGCDYEIEYRILRPDGEIRHVLEIGQAVADGDGRVAEQVGTLQDITERKAAEEALLAAKEEAELANRAKSEFLTNMSHELRTPLHVIIGFAELITNQKFGPIEPPKYREFAADIEEAGQHLLDLISDILDLSRIDSGSITIHEQDLDVAHLVENCAKLMAQRTEAASVELVVDMPSGQHPGLRADPRMLRQILVNLLSNAVKFTPHGGRVTLGCRTGADGAYLFEVRDTGIGIAPRDIPKALARFQQIDGQLDRKREGSGLGLPLTKSLVELHGGTLHLESKIGEGTIVTVRFPWVRTVPAPRVDLPPAVEVRTTERGA